MFGVWGGSLIGIYMHVCEKKYESTKVNLHVQLMDAKSYFSPPTT